MDTIRTFLKNFEAGDYNSEDVKTQIKAGWYDWFCQDSALRGKTYALTKKLKTIIDSPKINIDTMYVFFKNNCPMVGPLRDDFRICDMKTKSVLFTVAPIRNNVWGKENNFNGPIFQGNSWKTVKEYFNN